MGLKTQKRMIMLFSYTILIIWSLILFFPMYWVVITSFKNAVDMAVKATYLPFIRLPTKPTRLALSFC